MLHGSETWHVRKENEVALQRALLGDTESGINQLRCATLQCMACTSSHYATTDSHDVRALVEVCVVPVLLVSYCDAVVFLQRIAAGE